MKNENLQQRIDNIIYAIFGKIIPKSIKPNHLTVLRFLLIPMVFYLLNQNQNIWGLILFVITASTDFLDGTLARKRSQITDLGKIIDPIADKLLIGVMLYFVGIEHLIVKVFLVIIGFEIIAALTSGFAYKIIGRPVGANTFGKIKMVLQSFAVAVFLLGLVLRIENLKSTSIFILAVALLFAILSGIEQTRIRVQKLKR